MATLSGDAGGVRLVDVRAGDSCALLSQLARDALANSASSSRNDRDLSFEVQSSDSNPQPVGRNAVVTARIRLTIRNRHRNAAPLG
jgi:hypothetical protein